MHADVTFDVPVVSITGLLGRNGAGKTTLVRILLGLTRADAGTMSLLGVGVPAERSRALARVGAIVDEPRFHGHLTGRENLRLLAAARGGQADTRIVRPWPGSARPATRACSPAGGVGRRYSGSVAAWGVARSMAGQPTSASCSACSALPPPRRPNSRLASSR